MNIINLLKKIPIDLGQGTLRHKTKGKKLALSLVPDGIGKTAIDIGCQEGLQSQWLEKKGYTVTSIDIEKVYEKAQVVDVSKTLPFPDRSFDLLWCSEVIEHLKNPAKAIQEFRRVLKPGGRMILTTPNSGAWFFRLCSFFGLTVQKLQNPTHRQFFTLQTIRQLFPEALLYGYFPYVIVKCTIKRGLNLFTPTFVIEENK